MANDKDKAKADAFFILHNPDVVEKRVMEALNKLFTDRIDKPSAQRNAENFLYILMTADASANHPVMNRVMNDLFHSGRLRMGSGFGEADFIDSIRQLIRGVVQEEINRTITQLESRVSDLKRAEYNRRYNRFLG